MLATVDDREPVSATCSSCGAPFVYNLTFFKYRWLPAPKTCRPCRQARRDRLQTLTGTVATAGHLPFVFIDSGAGRFIGYPGFRVAHGDAVMFDVDPAEQPRPGRCRVARNVRSLDRAAPAWLR